MLLKDVLIFLTLFRLDYSYLSRKLGKLMLKPS